MLIYGQSIMTAVVMTSDFAHSARLRVTHLCLKKAIAAALFFACLHGACAFAEERASFASSFGPVKAESALGFYFLDFRTLWSTTHFPSTFLRGGSSVRHKDKELDKKDKELDTKEKEKTSTLSDWSAGLGLATVRPFESLPLSLFQPHSSRFSKFEPGLGSYFPDDKIGRSRISGAGLEENRWLYFKLKFRF
jgi:hypothetical protein